MPYPPTDMDDFIHATNCITLTMATHRSHKPSKMKLFAALCFATLIATGSWAVNCRYKEDLFSDTITEDLPLCVGGSTCTVADIEEYTACKSTVRENNKGGCDHYGDAMRCYPDCMCTDPYYKVQIDITISEANAADLKCPTLCGNSAMHGPSLALLPALFVALLKLF